jgi:hypothetical protein
MGNVVKLPGLGNQMAFEELEGNPLGEIGKWYETKIFCKNP